MSFTTEAVNASVAFDRFQKVPPALQFPGDAHEIELKIAFGEALWTPSANTAGFALPQTPFVDVSVNASSSNADSAFLNWPAAVQFPAVAHDTELKVASGFLGWRPTANTAGRAGAHSPSAIDMVNASMKSSDFLNWPTAVQFPAVAHDTELKVASGFTCWTPSANTARRARPHTPSVDVAVNASSKKARFRNLPTAVQFPADVHEIELNRALGYAG